MTEAEKDKSISPELACACLGCVRKPKGAACPCGQNCNCRCTQRKSGNRLLTQEEMSAAIGKALEKVTYG